MKDGISITIAVPLVNSSLSFFLSFFVCFVGRTDNKYRDLVRDRCRKRKATSWKERERGCRWLVRREDEVSLVLEQWGTTRASGSVHVLLPVTRRLIDSQPSCSVNVVYRVSSRPRCRVRRRLGESRRRLVDARLVVFVRRRRNDLQRVVKYTGTLEPRGANFNADTEAVGARALLPSRPI